MFPCKRVFLLGLAALALPTCVYSLPLNESSSSSSVRGTLHRRDYFYVGGDYVPQGNSTIASGQIYVEHLVPERVTQPLPLVMIHGHGMTGTNFLNTPDGRPGWGDYFLSEGFEVCSFLFYFIFHAN